MGYMLLSTETYSATQQFAVGQIDHQEIPMTKRDLGTPPLATTSEPHAPATGERISIFARLGSWTSTRLRLVLLSWLTILVVFGIFAPQVESALSGAGWQDSSSASVHARDIIQRDFSDRQSAVVGHGCERWAP